MSSNGTPKTRKQLQHKRERSPTRPARGDMQDVADSSPNDHKPASDPGSFIEPVTKDDPSATRMPSTQKEPPRAPGP